MSFNILLMGDNMIRRRRYDSSSIGNTDTYQTGIVSTTILVLLFIFVAFIVCFFWLRINSGVRHAMQEAKDIRIAFKMEAVEKYALGGIIYNPTTRNGMADGVEEKILKSADADGKIVLQAWDGAYNEPAAFTYQKDGYIIIFKKKDDGTAIWDGYYTLKLLEYK